MTNVDHLRHLVRFDEGDRSEYERLVDGIEFARAELGIDDSEIPASLTEVKQLRNELVSKLKPPTPAQLRELDSLLRATGGTLQGTLISVAPAQLLIDHLRDEKLPERSNTMSLTIPIYWVRLMTNRAMSTMLLSKRKLIGCSPTPRYYLL